MFPRVAVVMSRVVSASSGARLDLRWFHGTHAPTRLGQELPQPRDLGWTWSTVSAEPPQHEHAGHGDHRRHRLGGRRARKALLFAPASRPSVGVPAPGLRPGT